ncbi:hypothetical protein JXB01_01125 [Candidatus Micrarchaeota archaeon]|nr:hypothetical protein [Candidatus Micrarchaeota archaeon]
MEAKVKMKQIYRFDPFSQIYLPLEETQVLFQEDVMQYFKQHNLMEEGPITEVSAGIASVQDELAETRTSSEVLGEVGVKEKTKKETETVDFAIVYYNPVTKKSEVVHIKSEVVITDYIDTIEDSVKNASAYGIYKFVTTPLLTTEVNQEVLREIMDKIEIVSPKPFGGAMTVPRIIIEKTEKPEIEVLEGEKSRAEKAVVTALERKLEMAKKIDEEIVALEQAAEMLKGKKPLEKIIEKLPPKIRALVLVQIKKKKMDKEILRMLILEDVKFLEKIKIKLNKMSLKELIKLAKTLKGIKER